MLKAKVTRREREDKDLAIAELGKEETTRLNAEVPISLHKKVKLFGVQSDQSITEIVIDALNEYLSKHSEIQKV